MHLERQNFKCTSNQKFYWLQNVEMQRNFTSKIY